MKIFPFLLIALFAFSCSPQDTESNSARDSTDKPVVEIKQEVETKESPWFFGKAKDEFGDIKESKNVLLGVFDGKMSNSATEESDLKVKIQVGTDKKSTYITLYEYGRNPADLPREKFIKVKMKMTDGSIESFDQAFIKNMLIQTDGAFLEKILSQNGIVKVNIDLSRVDKNKSSVYNFPIDPHGLKEKMNQMEGKE